MGASWVGDPQQDSDYEKYLLEPSLANIKNIEGNLPLHCVLMGQYSAATTLTVLRAYPHAVRNLSSLKQSPLELSIIHSGDKPDSEAIIIPILDLYSEQASKFTSDNTKFLHCAANYLKARTGPIVIRAILAVDPQSLTLRCPKTNLYALQIACRNNCLYVAKELISLFPEACRDQYDVDSYPLHYFCSKEEDFSSEILTAIRVFPEACAMRGSDGLFPLQLYCSKSYHLNAMVIKRLLECYPNAAYETGECTSPSSLGPIVFPLQNLVNNVYRNQIAINSEVLQCFRNLVPANPSAVDLISRFNNKLSCPVLHIILYCKYNHNTTTLLRLLLNSSEEIFKLDQKMTALSMLPAPTYKRCNYSNLGSLARELNWESRKSAMSLLAKLSLK